MIYTILLQDLIYKILLQYVTNLIVVSCRFELYLSAKQHTDEPLPVDTKTGPAAVVRNMRHVLAASPPA